MTSTTSYIGVHAFRRGVAKSLVAANLAVLLAGSGRRVALVGTGRRSDDLGRHLGIDVAGPGFDDVVAGRSEIAAAARDVSTGLVDVAGGSLWVVPGAPSDAVPFRDVEHEPERFGAVFHDLVEQLHPDVVVLDMEAGLTQDTMEILALIDDLAVLVRPDRQDHQGTAVMLDVARRLSVLRCWLVLSHVVSGRVRPGDRIDVEAAFGAPVQAILPFAEELAADDGAVPFVVRRPDHPWSAAMRELATTWS